MTPDEVTIPNVLRLLEQGKLDVEGLVPWGSNYTFLARVTNDAAEVYSIYKPRKGERPLWDFARGSLCQRERAAYLVSEGLNWGIVPPTVLRQGPQGYGSVQYYVEHDPQQHYLTFEGQYPEQLHKFVLFDILINNADRKSGHVLLGLNGRLWAIDHGICFHEEYKLRSVIWEFAGDAVPSELLADLTAFHVRICNCTDDLCKQLSSLLSSAEMEAMKRRLSRLIDTAIFPHPGSGRHYPWPLV
jgi:hypothetical protein